MRTKIKKLFSLTLILAFLIGILPTFTLPTAARSEYQGFILEQEFGSSTGSISGYNGTETEIVIPKEINGVKITSLRRFLNVKITKITIPETVTELDICPFDHCTSLEEIQVDENNPNFASEQGVLFSKDKKNLIRYPSGKKEFTYEISDGVTTIECRAFNDASFLTNIICPNSLTYIYDGAFRYCTSLTMINLPENIGYINDELFFGCASLTTIPLPEKISSIGASAFSGCMSLGSIKLPNGLKWIYSNAFSSCSALTGMKIPDGVTYLGYQAFSDCSSLKNIYLPNSLIHADQVGDDILIGCSSFQTVFYAGTEQEFENICYPFRNVNCVYNYIQEDTRNRIGDVTGDGEVNSADGTLLARHLAKWNVQIEESGADINGDGEVNSADGALLARYLAKWDIAYFN